jgi:hypothetical protein
MSSRAAVGLLLASLVVIGCAGASLAEPVDADVDGCFHGNEGMCDAVVVRGQPCPPPLMPGPMPAGLSPRFCQELVPCARDLRFAIPQKQQYCAALPPGVSNQSPQAQQCVAANDRLVTIQRTCQGAADRVRTDAPPRF